jgi:ATP-dependent DNA helicase RecG
LIDSTDSESTTKISAVWFNQPFIIKQLHEGETYFFFGKVKKDGNQLIFQSPAHELAGIAPIGEKIGHVLPVYRRIKIIRSTSFRPWNRGIVSQVELQEYVPSDLLYKYSTIPLNEAYRMVHVPVSVPETEVGYRRIAMQELCELRSSYEKNLKVETSIIGGIDFAKKVSVSIGLAIKQLPFTLTISQVNSIEKIVSGLAESKKIDTFIYGDVGSGKTIVVLLIAQAMLLCGYSVLLAAPTSILAEQHVKTAQRLLGKVLPSTSIELVTGKSVKKKLDASIPTLFIGTHALLFRDFLAREKIALSIVDEQHRFGVVQRKLLAQQQDTHVITLSATPIPRTLALSFLGFSDTIELKEKPQGRKEIITKIVPFGKEEVTYQWINKHLQQDERVYMVFPRIEDDELGEKQSLLAMAEFLKSTYFAHVSTAILYGGMKEAEKAEIMNAFARGEIKLLFSTTVIEVGVDVPEATIIAIHGAENFGLAQLHQLRGRVGRSDKQGYCFLLAQELADNQLDRLSFFSEHNDGLSVSEYDLKNRGSGTLLGEIQAGESELKVATLQNLSLIQDAMSLYVDLKAKSISIPSIVSV